jgi:hypothetical protein
LLRLTQIGGRDLCAGIPWLPPRRIGGFFGGTMADRHDLSVQRSEPRIEQERRKRELFLSFAEAVLNP